MKLEDVSGKIVIFGAKSIALGIYKALQILFPENEVIGFMVSSAVGNPKTLAGLPVKEVHEYAGKYISGSGVVGCGKDEITILIGTPETIHNEIIRLLENYGFLRYICIGWKLEETLMEQFYIRKSCFLPLRQLSYNPHRYNDVPVRDRLCVFQVKNHMDCGLAKLQKTRRWMHTIQAGSVNTKMHIAEYTDDAGESISEKNGNYCELTALYWIWKNLLETGMLSNEYCGIFQYRRLLHMEDEDIYRIWENQVDVVLPFPTVHEPDIREHHERYIKERDWLAMLQALQELRPYDAKTFERLSRQPYLYNYNILIARKEVLRDYCKWLFPILERTEIIARPEGGERMDRYIGYLGENLLTLYFMSRADRLKIVHTGREMLV